MATQAHTVAEGKAQEYLLESARVEGSHKVQNCGESEACAGVTLSDDWVTRLRLRYMSYLMTGQICFSSRHCYCMCNWKVRSNSFVRVPA